MPRHQMAPVQLIYIGGFGGSGSTLLETLLAKNPEVVACGEVVEALTKWDPERRCSCGKPAAACPVWGALPDKTAMHSGWRHKDLDAALMQIIAPDASIMVDSSKTRWKTAFAPFSLQHAFGANFSLVHLVRDPRAVCWSVTKREMRRAEKAGGSPRLLRQAIVSALGWVIANLTCELFGLFHHDRYLRVRYEDLAREPRATMENIFRILINKSDFQFEDEAQTDNRHQLFGNQLRRVHLTFSDVHPDNSWTGNIPASSLRVTEIICGWLRRRYETDPKAGTTKA